MEHLLSHVQIHSMEHLLSHVRTHAGMQGYILYSLMQAVALFNAYYDEPNELAYAPSEEALYVVDTQYYQVERIIGVWVYRHNEQLLLVAFHADWLYSAAMSVQFLGNCRVNHHCWCAMIHMSSFPQSLLMLADLTCVSHH